MDEARSQEVREKETRLRAWMRSAGYAGVLLRTHRNFFWSTAGGGNPVIVNLDPGFQSVLFTLERRYVLSQPIEMPRIKEEETPGLGFEYIEYNWWEEDLAGLARELVKGTIGCDLPLPGAQVIEPELRDLRVAMNPWELERYRRLGADAARCLEETCHELKPGMEERKIAAGLAGRLLAEGIRFPVLLVGTDERVHAYRHPVPTDKKLKRYVMIGLCAERGGLIVATTRLVHFGNPPDELSAKYQGLRKVAAAVNLSSRPGATVGHAFDQAVKAYAGAGYPDEWKKHYQGGVCGYLPREVSGSPGEPFVLAANQAVAWNPTITGTKLEDTLIIKEDGFENITLTRTWPSSPESVDGGSIVLAGILRR
jgi:Xaa-Pro dipeptidase